MATVADRAAVSWLMETTAASETLSGIVLAAGAGERMGGPKAVLVVEGEPLAGLHARRLREVGCDPVVLVTRGELVERLSSSGAIVVSSGAPDPAGSLAVGLRALSLASVSSLAPEGLLVLTPVDSFPASPATFALLLAATGALPRFE